MAFSPHYNITGSTGVSVELIAPGEDISNIKSILLTNIHATATATVTLFIQNDPESNGGTTNTFKLLNTVAIPSDTALLLDNQSMLNFKNSGDNSFGLYITVGGSDTLDVFINV